MPRTPQPSGARSPMGGNRSAARTQIASSKLGIKAGSRLRLIAAPPGFAAPLGADMPVGVVSTEGAADVAVVFADWERDLLAHVEAVRPALPDAGSLWIAWPKRASKRPADIT